MIAERIARRPDCQHHLVGAHRMANVRPYFPARMQGRQRIDGHVQDTRDFRGPRLAIDPECDGDLAHPQVLADQRSERGHRTTGGAGEDRREGLGLLIVGALIDVGGQRPSSVSHDPGGVEDDENIESIERDVAIAATFDVEDQRHVTKALGRSRGQWSGR
jgi:hypothetical protein